MFKVYSIKLFVVSYLEREKTFRMTVDSILKYRTVLFWYARQI